MIRTAVTTYLVILTAVGPLACCCHRARLTAWLVTRTQPQTVAPCPCCPAPAPADDEDRPARRDCPCKHGASCQLASLAALPRGTTDEAQPSPAPWLLAPALLPLHGADLMESESRPPPGLPFLSTRDLLRVHHLLRC